MKKLLYPIAFALTAFLILYSCSTESFLFQSETREISPFDGIDIAGGPYEVTLSSGKEGSITLSGNVEDLENTKSYIINGKLIIKNKRKYRPREKVTIGIPIEEISSVILRGSGKIKSQKIITSNRFKTVISGSGDIDLKVEATSIEAIISGSGVLHLSGKTENVEYKITGSGNIFAKDLKSQIGQVKITGAGDIEMYTSESLNVNITGSGNLLCYGNPERQITKVTGSGNITIRD